MADLTSLLSRYTYEIFELRSLAIRGSVYRPYPRTLSSGGEKQDGFFRQSFLLPRALAKVFLVVILVFVYCIISSASVTRYVVERSRLSMSDSFLSRFHTRYRIFPFGLREDSFDRLCY